MKYSDGNAFRNVTNFPRDVCQTCHLEGFHKIMIKSKTKIVMFIKLVILWQVWGGSTGVQDVHIDLTKKNSNLHPHMGIQQSEHNIGNLLGYVHVFNQYHQHLSTLSGWWFGTFFIFPYIGNNHPNWLIFFRGVESTNQLSNLQYIINR